jgi:hypothetical protein
VVPALTETGVGSGHSARTLPAGGKSPLREVHHSNQRAAVEDLGRQANHDAGLVVRQPWIGEFGGLFTPPVELERTAICQNRRDGYNARIQHVSTVREFWGALWKDPSLPGKFVPPTKDRIS